MSTGLLLDNFDLLLDAPNSIPKLRETILQLAVQGKLVPQDAKDEPASELLKRIRVEKEALIKQGKLKQEKPLPPIREDEIPFDLPTGWEWCRLGGVINRIMGGGTPSKAMPDYWHGKIPWASVKDLKGKYLEGTIDSITESGLKNSSANLVPKGSVIVCTRMGLGKIAINTIEVAINQDLKALFLSDSIYVDYFYNWFRTLRIVGTGMTVNGITQDELLNYLIPLPPLAEQHRIVAKVAQLMKLCDELEEKQKRGSSDIITLNNSALSLLSSVGTESDFNREWSFVRNNFDILYSTPENVKRLKEIILQLAVQGKLAPQDPNDEPASELLKRIKAEKEALIKQGKLKKEKPLPPIKEDEMQFDLPNGWIWCKLGEISHKITDGTHHSPPNSAQGEYKYITAKNIKTFGIDLNEVTYVTEAVHREIYSRCNPEYGDILFVKDGATTGVVTVNDLDEPFSMLSSVSLIKISPNIVNRYIVYALRSPYYYESTRNDMSGVAITRVTLAKLQVSKLPLPPLAEQQRIVAKVDSLMAHCKELEEHIATSKSHAAMLMQSVLKEAFSQAGTTG